MVARSSEFIETVALVRLNSPSLAPSLATVKLLDRESWSLLATQFVDYNYRQSWAYGLAMAQLRGATSEHVAIDLQGEIVGLADVRIKKVPLVGRGLAYISGGPLTFRTRSDHRSRLARVLEALSAEYCIRRRLVLRVLMPIGGADWALHANDTLNRLDFRPTDIHPGYRTMVVDIDQPLSQIRAGFAQKWRNCLNAAERQGLKVRIGTDSELLDSFCDLYDGFAQRKGFHVDLRPQFYARIQRETSESERLVVSMAYRDGIACAGHVASMLGDTSVYMFGATDEVGLKTKAAYLLQWSAITSAKERGLLRYDLGGIDPLQNPGVYHFKAGLNGEEQLSPGPAQSCQADLWTNFSLRAERLLLMLRRGRRQPTSH